MIEKFVELLRLLDHRRGVGRGIDEVDPGAQVCRFPPNDAHEETPSLRVERHRARHVLGAVVLAKRGAEICLDRPERYPRIADIAPHRFSRRGKLGRPHEHPLGFSGSLRGNVAEPHQIGVRRLRLLAVPLLGSRIVVGLTGSIGPRLLRAVVALVVVALLVSVLVVGLAVAVVHEAPDMRPVGRTQPGEGDGDLLAVLLRQPDLLAIEVEEFGTDLELPRFVAPGPDPTGTERRRHCQDEHDLEARNERPQPSPHNHSRHRFPLPSHPYPWGLCPPPNGSLRASLQGGKFSSLSAGAPVAAPRAIEFFKWAQSKGLSSRSTAECGQDDKGKNGPGKTCAKGDGSGGQSALPAGRAHASKCGRKYAPRKEKVVEQDRKLSDDEL